MGLCQLGKECKDSHPKKERESFLARDRKENSGKEWERRENTGKECVYWLNGDCRYPRQKECSRGIHKPERMGIRKRTEDPSFLSRSSMDVFRGNPVGELPPLQTRVQMPQILQPRALTAPPMVWNELMIRTPFGPQPVSQMIHPNNQTESLQLNTMNQAREPSMGWFGRGSAQ